MKSSLRYLVAHPYYGILITMLTNLAGLAFLWTSLNAWGMADAQLLGFKSQTLTWGLGAVSNLVLAAVLYATDANKISQLTIVVWLIGMLNLTIVVLAR